MDRSGIVYLTQEEFGQLDISAIDRILNGIHLHRSRLDGQEVFAMQARAVLTHGRNKPPEPAPRPQPPSTSEDASDGGDGGSESDDSGPNGDASNNERGGSNDSCGHDPGAARSKREMRDAERRAARLADYPEIADALAAGQISTEQADLISRAKVSTHTKLELLADARHEHADQTAEAVKAAVREADSESADDRLNRQRGNRRGGCGVNDDGMYWLSLLIDPVTGARIKHAYDPRFRAAWAAEKQLDLTERRVPKQVAGDVIANMLLGLPAIYDLHPQAQADAHHQPMPESARESGRERDDASSSSASGRPPSSPSAEPAFGFGSPPEPVPATTNTPSNPGVRFVEIGKDADGNEIRTDLGSYTPIRPAPLFNIPPDPTQSDGVGLDPPDSDRTCPSCRSGSPPPATIQGKPRAEVSVVIGLSDLNALDDRQAVGFTADGVPMPASVVRA
ncbi:hypothetical protein JYT71_00455, partial [Acidimicrobiaceae bacterium AH-315-P05]|nr:hypothetical protein [Acidimicrobiaceae bacterium AH-315-P05]